MPMVTSTSIAPGLSTIVGAGGTTPNRSTPLSRAIKARRTTEAKKHQKRAAKHKPTKRA